jgi:hypothetical protein
MVMAEILTFSKVHDYNTRETGITVRARLYHALEITDVTAKIDTGASHCIFSRDVGEMLGLIVESGSQQSFLTAAGSFITFGHEVTLSVLGIETVTTVFFAKDENFNRNVLGRQGWLDRVRLGLIDYEGKLYLSAYNEADV